MSTEQTPKQATDTPPRLTVEERVERFFTYWGRALVAAVRTVFPPKETHK
jgi:hypothetical protein